MFDAMVRLLGISRRPHPPARPTPAPPPGQRSPRKEAAQAQPPTSLVKVAHAQKAGASISGKVEPAMAVIPRDAVQMPPRAAAPGLPPVDPVMRPAARQVLPPPGSTSAISSPSDAGSLSVGDRVPRPGLRNVAQGSARSCPAPETSTIGTPQVRHGASGEKEANPLRPSSIGHAQNSIPPRRPAPPGTDNGPVRDPNQGELFPEMSTSYEHSMEAFAKDRAINPLSCGLDGVRGHVVPAETRGHPPTLDVDLAAGSSLSVVDKPVEKPPRVPPRVADRPKPEEWTDDELLTLPEAAALFWPAGPITTNTLRTAGRDGTLAITKVAGKFFTTPLAIRMMGAREAVESPASAGSDEMSATAAFQMKLAEAHSLGGGRARSRRAAKKPSTPVVPAAAWGGKGRHGAR